MVAEETVRDFVNRLAAAFSPDKVILFGSYARGNAGPDSDVDLLVIMPTKKRTLQQAVEIRQRVPCPFPLDLIVKTPEEVEQRLRWGDFFLEEILAEGRVLHDASRS